MPRFVILHHHQIENPHWDLMLERDESLATWQVAANPATWSANPITCRRIFDHRKKYLNYQGPLSDDRGQVKRHETGNFHPIEISERHWSIELQSQKLTGTLSLTQITDDQWYLYFKPD